MRTVSTGCALLLLGLSGCSDALIYGERTGFNLAIRVNDDPATPINVNAGLERTVVSLAPPLGGEIADMGRGVAAGESVSAISRFELHDDRTARTLLSGKLTIRTQFLSGEAAIRATENKTTAVKVVQLVTMSGRWVSTPAGERLDQLLGDPPSQAAHDRLVTCAAAIPGLRGIPDPELVGSPHVTDVQRQQLIACMERS